MRALVAKNGPVRRWFRRLRRGLEWIVLVTLLVVSGVVQLLQNLDAPRVKRHIVAWTEDKVGLAIDYDEGGVERYGVRFTNLRVKTPPSRDGQPAPDLLRVGLLQLRWQLGELLFSSLKFEELLIRDVQFTLSSDEHDSSLDRVLARLPSGKPPPAPTTTTTTTTPPPPPPTPTVRGPGPLERGFGVALERLRIEQVGVTIERWEAGKRVARTAVTGVTLDGALDALHGVKAELQLGTAEKPGEVRVLIERAGAPDRELVAAIDEHLQVRGGRILDRLHVRVVRQSLAPKLAKLDDLVRLEAAVQVDAKGASTRVRVAQLALLDGALRGDATLDLGEGPGGEPAPVVRTAEGHAALDRIALALVGIIGPVEAPGGRLDYHVRELSLAGVPQFAVGGSLGLELKLERLAMDAGTTRVRLGPTRLSLRGKPVHDRPLVVDGEAELRSLELRDGARLLVSGDGLSLDLDASTRTPNRLDDRLDGRVRLRGAHLAWASGAAGNADVTVRVEKLRVDRSAQLGVRAGLSVAGTVGQLDLPPRVRARGVGLSASLPLEQPPYALTLALPVVSLTLLGPHGETLVDGAATRVDVTVSNATPELTAPLRSRGKLDAKLALGPLGGTLTVDKAAPDRLTFATDLHTPSLELVRSFLPPSVAKDYQIPWARMSVTLGSKGSVTHLGPGAAPSIDEQTTLRVDRAAIAGKALDLGADRLLVTIRSHGDATRGSFDAQVAFEPLRIAARTLPKQSIAAQGSFDLSRPRLDLKLKGEGGDGLRGDLLLLVEWDAGKRTLHEHTQLRFDRLALVAPFLPPIVRDGLDWRQLTVELTTELSLRGLLRGWKGLTPLVEPLDKTRGDLQLDLTIGEAHWRTDTLRADVPKIVVHERTSLPDGTGPRRHELSTQLASAHVEVQGNRIELEGFDERASFETDGYGSLARSDGRLTLATKLAKLTQSVFPSYAIRDAQLATKVHGDFRGALELDEARFDNPGGGTLLTLAGGLDLTPRKQPAASARAAVRTLDDGALPGRRSVALRGALTQKLEALDGDPKALTARGTLELPFTVESGDLQLFRLAAALRPHGVHVELPARKLIVDGLDGDIPIEEELLVDPVLGTSLLGDERLGAYPRVRFSDYHPFLSDKTFVSATHVELGAFAVGPLAGNALVKRNLVAIEQLELGVRGGHATGQLLAEMRGPDTEIALRGNVTGLGSADGKERLDANAALTLAPGRLDAEGRVEFLRISPRLLGEVVDLIDPYRASVGLNRVRLALKLGYPKLVRLRFDQGFASLLIELGGLVRAVRIDEIRSIPVGPLLKRYLSPIVGGGDQP